MAFQPDQCGILGDTMLGTPFRDRQDQGGQQPVVHAAVEQGRHRGQQGVGDHDRHLDAVRGDHRRHIDGGIERALGQQRIRALDDAAPEVQLTAALVGDPFESM